MPFITQGKANLKYILIIVVLAAIVGGGILGYQYWWVAKEEIPPGTENKKPAAEVDNRFAQCFKNIKIPSNYHQAPTPDQQAEIISDLIPEKIADYTRLTIEIPDKNQWPSSYSGNLIQAKSGIAARYALDPNKGDFVLELSITEYLDDKKEEVDFYTKLITDKNFLKSFQDNQENVSNPTFSYQKEAEGLKYLLDDEPKSQFSEGSSAIITTVPERNLLIAFAFQKHEPKAEEIFRTWLSSVCP